MIKEYFGIQSNQQKIEIKDTKIFSFRNRNILEKSIRIFDEDNKKFGISAAVGDVSDDELESKAIDLLSLNIPYNYELERNLSATFLKEQLAIEDLESFTEKTLTDLKEFCKNYVLSGSVYITENKISLNNSLGLNLKKIQKSLYLGITMKLKGSGNVFDAFSGFSSFDLQDSLYSDFLKDTEFLAKACSASEVNLENKKYKILSEADLLLNKFKSDICAIPYHEKSSLLSDKLNEKIFNENINISESSIDDDYCFFVPFDHEGIVRIYDLPIVENGVLKTILYDKKTSAKYGTKTTGNGFRHYNFSPVVCDKNLFFKGDFPKASDLITDEYVIIPFTTSGGDILTNGNYSLPVQLAFVFQNGKFVGKAPQFTLTGNYLDTYNDDFISLTQNDIFKSLFSKNLLFFQGNIDLI